MSQERFVAFSPPLKPTSGVDVVANDAAAAKAREAAQGSYSAVGGLQDVAAPGTRPPPTDSTPTRSRLAKKYYSFHRTYRLADLLLATISFLTE